VHKSIKKIAMRRGAELEILSFLLDLLEQLEGMCITCGAAREGVKRQRAKILSRLVSYPGGSAVCWVRPLHVLSQPAEWSLLLCFRSGDPIWSRLSRFSRPGHGATILPDWFVKRQHKQILNL
jgi:hypothetical protein